MRVSLVITIIVSFISIGFNVTFMSMFASTTICTYKVGLSVRSRNVIFIYSVYIILLAIHVLPSIDFLPNNTTVIDGC